MLAQVIESFPSDLFRTKSFVYFTLSQFKTLILILSAALCMIDYTVLTAATLILYIYIYEMRFAYCT